MKDVNPSILRGCFQMVSIRSRTPDVGHLAFTLEHFTSPLITRGFSVRTSAWGIAFCCFCAFCHRQGRLLFGQHYSLPRYSCFFPQNTVGKKGLVGYSIHNCRVCMGTRFSSTTKHVHTTILGSVMDNRSVMRDCSPMPLLHLSLLPFPNPAFLCLSHSFCLFRNSAFLT